MATATPEAKRQAILEDCLIGMSQRLVAEKHGVAQSTVSAISREAMDAYLALKKVGRAERIAVWQMRVELLFTIAMLGRNYWLALKCCDIALDTEGAYHHEGVDIARTNLESFNLLAGAPLIDDTPDGDVWIEDQIALAAKPYTNGESTNGKCTGEIVP